MNFKDYHAEAATHCFSRKLVLVTDGSGFLGPHLCERLLAENCDVLCVDNFFHRGSGEHFKDQRVDGFPVSDLSSPLASDAPRQRCQVITLAQTELGWQPRTDLEQGLTKTIAYFETMPGNPINKKD